MSLPVPDHTLLALQSALAGRFSIDRERGRGGMGIVYLAWDLALDRAVAIKLLAPHLAVSALARERFVREAQMAARLSHPHIVPIHAVEAQGDLVWFVMTYVPGETLAERVRRAGPLPVSDALRVMQEVAWALAYAHQHGVIHRDVKPGNILLERGSGRAVVLDFGIAQLGGDGEGGREGTPAYMSPEQHRGDPLDGRADLFSLGVTVQYALTGQLPPRFAETGAGLVARAAAPVTAIRPEVPLPFAQAIRACLDPMAGGRPASGEALAESLAACQSRTLPVAPAVREFLRVTRATGVEIGSGVAILVVLALEALIVPGGTATKDFIPFILTYGVPIVAGLGSWRLVQMIRRARGLLRQGFTHEEIRDAVEEDAAPPETSRPVGGWGKRLGMVMGGAGAAAAWVLLLRWWALLPNEFGFVRVLLDAILWSALTLGPVAAARAAINLLMEPGRSRIGKWLWNFALDWKVFRIARLGLEAGEGRERASLSLPSVPDAADRATTLLGELPADVRQAFGDLPEALARLRGRAAALRVREEELARALLEAESVGEDDARVSERRRALIADLRSARDEASRRHAEAEAAIETIRLALLRIRAGLGEGARGDLTADLEAALTLQQRIDGLLADEVLTPQ